MRQKDLEEYVDNISFIQTEILKILGYRVAQRSPRPHLYLILEKIDTATCTWTEDKDCYGCWASDCGHTWVFNDGGPTENGMKHCPFCGELLKEKKFEGDE